MPRTNSTQQLQEISANLGTDELVKRLKACSKHLQDCESLDDDNKTTLSELSTALAQPFLHQHRSREVRTLVACCIADIFRVFYPEPPYDDNQMRAVFSLFVSQLQGLEKPSSPAFKQSFHLLEILANLRVFVLCLSIDAQDVLVDLFKMFFSIINNDQSSKVKNYIMDILSSLVQEGESLSQEIMDIILMNILEPTKSENKVVYHFTVEFIRKTSSYIEPYIHLFFNNTLVVGKSSESEVADHLYELILELHSIDSSVLLAVLPQLEFKLKSVDTSERLEVTKLLAKMFSPKGSKLASENKPLWNCFLGRFSDVNTAIRLECVKYSKYFLVYHPHIKEDAANKLHERFYDKEEKVRLEVVKAVCEAASDDFDCIPEMLWKDLQGRMRDKVWNIRKESVINLARLYRKLMSSSFSSGNSLNSTDARYVSLSWIPTKILHCYYRQSIEDKLLVERCLLSCLVPINLGDDERMERLVRVYAALEDEHATKALDALLLARQQLLSQLLTLLNIQGDTKIDKDKKKLAMRNKITQLALGLPDPQKTQGQLHEFSTMLEDNPAIRDSLIKACDISLSCQDVMKAKSDVVNDVNQVVSKSDKHGVNILETVRNLLDRTCPMLIDSHCVEILVETTCSELCEPSLSISEEDEEEETRRAKKAVHLIKVLATINPGHFKSSEVFERLIALLRNEDLHIAGLTLQILTLTGDHIDKKVAGCLQPILTNLAHSGPSELAKHTITCIQKVFIEPKPIMERLLDTLTSNLDYDDENLHTVLISLSQIAKLQPEVFAMKHKQIIRDFVVKQLLVVDRAQNEYVEGSEEWCDDSDVSDEARAKILGMKLLVCWLLGLKSDFEKSSQPVLKLLSTVLAHDGDLQAEDNISAPNRSRLRVAAGACLLKLARSSHYRELITHEQFQRIALIIQDTCVEVRKAFAAKLNKGLKTLHLGLGYLAILALGGIEPDKEARATYHQAIALNIEKRRDFIKQHSKAKENQHVILPEYAVPHAIYLIAHHPDFSRTNPMALDTFKDCLWFFLEPIVTRGDNYGFLRKLLENIKLTVDAQDPSNSEANKNIYATCDLAMGVMMSKMAHKNLGSFEGNILLPAQLFQTKGKSTQPNDIRYLPPEYDCTPTKRAKSEAMNTTIDNQSTPSKRAQSKTPTKTSHDSKVSSATKAKPAKSTPAKKTDSRKSATPAKKTPTKTTPGRSGGKSKEKTDRTPQGKKGTGRSPKKGKQVDKNDSGVSDVEMDDEEGGDMENTSTKGTRKRAQVAQPTRKRNVRRKVLQGDDEDDSVTLALQKEAKSEKKPPTRGRASKRKLPAAEEDKEEEEDDTNTNGVDQVSSEASQSDADSVPLPNKKRKVDASEETETKDASTSSSTGIKRRTRQRR